MPKDGSFYEFCFEHSLSAGYRNAAKQETEKYRGKFIKFFGPVLSFYCNEFEIFSDSFWLPAGSPVFVIDARYAERRIDFYAKTMFFFCIYGEKLICARECDADYKLC
jgi:hypothetical protein